MCSSYSEFSLLITVFGFIIAGRVRGLCRVRAAKGKRE